MDKINRTIKFRIWSPKEELFAIIDGNMVGKIGNFIHPSRIELDNNGELFDLHGESVIYQQFTGLLDSKGKEIYEGDIVRHELLSLPINGVVEWVSESDGYDYSGWTTTKAGHGCGDFVSGTTVIGNIFENPELLN